MKNLNSNKQEELQKIQDQLLNLISKLHDEYFDFIEITMLTKNLSDASEELHKMQIKVANNKRNREEN